jgi:hypothetical protein
MSENNDQTNPGPPEFDFSRFPFNTLFHERRTVPDRRAEKKTPAAPGEPSTDGTPIERRAKKDRRRRIDPTTFDKQYTDDEMEFMNAMQRYKEISGKSFPTYREVLKVLIDLGYRLTVVEPEMTTTDAQLAEPVLVSDPNVDALQI